MSSTKIKQTENFDCWSQMTQLYVLHSGSISNVIKMISVINIYYRRQEKNDGTSS